MTALPEEVEPCATADSQALLAVVDAFAKVASRVGEGRDLDPLLRLIAEQICVLTGVRRCTVFLLDRGAGIFRGRTGYSDEDISMRVQTLVCGVEADRFTKEIVETKEAVAIVDARRDPRVVRGLADRWKTTSMIGVPMILRDEVIGLLFADDLGRTRIFTPEDKLIARAFAELAAVALAQGQLLADLNERLDTVNRQNAMMRRATRVEQRLTKLAIDGCTVAQIAETVAELTGKVVGVRDADNRQIASAAPPGVQGIQSIPPLDDDVQLNPEVAATLVAIRDRDRPTVTGPLPSAGVRHRFLVSPVRIRDEYWGRLILMEHPSSFNSFDMLISQRAASIIAWEMSAERRASAAEWNARWALTDELLRGTHDPASVLRRAEFLGHSLTAPHAICLFAGPAGEAAGEQRVLDVERVAHACGDGASPLATGTTEGVALVVPLAGDDPFADGIKGVKAQVRRALQTLDLPDVHAGISGICAGLADYPRAYQHAVQAVQCLRSFAGDEFERVLAIDDLGAGRVLLSASDPDEVNRFADEALGPLLDGTREHATLLMTLAMFFDFGRSVRRTALELDVHENTIRYRLAGVQKATGLDVAADPQAQLSAQLALLVLHLRGALPPRVEVRG